ncbi:MAG: AAA family ATPase [Gammaproteobacteria bacterium]|nr:AAA family ATPase [Gammaproteobacteria bacterium]
MLHIPAGTLDAYIPRELQARLRDAAGRLKGERRNVTFLFADLVGSAALSERMELELYQLFMERALGTFIEGVVAYEGMVARLSGDGLLAFFGAPLAHEDDAERAVYAALQMQANLARLSSDLEKSYDTPVRARIGINAGEAIIGEIGSDLRLEYTAVGPAINVAARLESAADEGGILVGEQVFREAEAVFEFDGPRELELKGISDPVRAWAPLKARESPRPKRAAAGGTYSTLVGRDIELAQLERAMDELRSGRGQVVLVLGEAGIGKSRLAFECHQRFGQGVRWAVGRSLSYTTRSSFHPFVEIVRDLVGIDSSDTPTVSTLKLKRFLAPMTAEQQARHEPLIATLLHLPLDTRAEAEVKPLSPKATIKRLGEAITAILAMHGAEAPIVLVLDDLHWTDRASMDLLQEVLAVIESQPVLVLLLMRPDPDCAAWPLLAHIQSTYFNRRLELDLKPLPSTAATMLVEDLMLRESLPAAVKTQILEKSGGNPLSLEELVRVLLERRTGAAEVSASIAPSDVDALEVPETIQKIILSRFDRLAANERGLLQAASVLGRYFVLEVLEAVVELEIKQPLLALARADFIQERIRGSERGYVFKHWLTQEAIHSTLLDSEAKRLHKRVMQVLEDRGAPSAELARHALAADEHEKAFHLSLAATRDDMRLLAVESALDHCARALEAAERLGRKDMAFQAYAHRGQCYMRVANWSAAKKELEAALSQLDANEEERRAEVLVELQDADFWLLDIPSLIRHCEEARTLAERHGREDLVVSSIAWRAAAHGADGELEQGARLFDEANARGARAAVRLPAAAHPLRCAFHYWRGQLDNAIGIGQEAVANAHEANHGGAVVFAYSNFALSLAGRGRYREAMEALAEAQRFGMEFGVHTQRARALAIRAGFRNDLEDFAGAEEWAEQARELARSLDFPPPMVSSGIDLLINFARRGEPGRTEAILPWVSDMSAKSAGFHGWLWRIRLLDARSEVALSRSDWTEALELAHATIAESSPQPRPKYMVRGLMSRTRALNELGRTREAIASIKDALTTSRTLHDPALLLRVLALHLELDGSDDLGAEARESIRVIQGGLGEGPERSAFDQSDLVARVGRFLS